ncbi:DsrE family protein [Pseudidiomarina sp. 1ASP75-14]|uniref:DsrE/DsrF/TusD sulfur relay family protein n=1 Tax=Pseudidiomarina terrestris TaxID=2820060 RepID=UPI00264EA4D5|nr:DsrE family protein [Pseudidiomarina sp. 1ASP75-14]MDN7137868.1 DsrE family protein [Pseudidiomarina sp. 1ASP75-14]
MTDIVISVHAAPITTVATTSARSLLAFHYAQAALALGHRIHHVFFYQAGVLHAQLQEDGTLTPVAADWVRLSQQHGFPLVVCSTMVENDYQLQPEQLHQAYELGGLTEFSMATAKAERVVQF